MSVKAIREHSGKRILGTHVIQPEHGRFVINDASVPVLESTDLDKLTIEHPWLLERRLVVKPDQLIKRRGKGNLLLLNADWATAKEWINERRGKFATVGSVTGRLRTFIIEEFIPHESTDEYYVCIYSTREGDRILFHHEGGVDIGDVDQKAVFVDVAVDSTPDKVSIHPLFEKVPEARQTLLSACVLELFRLYRTLYFSYLEINPLVVVGDRVFCLDLAAKLDQCAEFEVGNRWGAIDFPPPFGRDSFPAERVVAEMDSKTGASLKLTILNEAGRVWTMVAGGGASVVYADTVADLGFSSELANYGEYSGAPNETQTYEYAKTILELMTRSVHPDGKVLIIGGGIANFTNVATTFSGIVRAITELADTLRDQNIQIYVRRGGPNWQEGLNNMRKLGQSLRLPIYVYGPETHMTAVVAMALGKRVRDDLPSFENSLGTYLQTGNMPISQSRITGAPVVDASETAERRPSTLFTSSTRSIVYGLQPRAVQSMFDFDFCCGRKQPSVAAMIYPFSGNHVQKFYWGKDEVFVSVFERTEEAMRRNPDVDTLVNFASLRSVYESTMEAMKFPQIRVIAIIAEGVPEYRTKLLMLAAEARKVTIIGPATVGGIKPGCFRIGNTGGMIDNVIASKLHRPGSVAYVSKSGGLSNELNNIIARHADGVFEGVAIGGDRYPGTTFIDHVLRYEDEPGAKLIVLLGEVGGVEEYRICEAIRTGRIKKPVVAWCIGTCAKMFQTDVQFGHAGSMANGASETADAKNVALRESGAVVPSSFDELGNTIEAEFRKLMSAGVIVLGPEPPVPQVPIDYSWAQELGLIRKPASFLSRISDDRGEELLYSGMTLSEMFEADIGVGGVLGLLWFRRLLPKAVNKYIEMVLMVCADHGPAVSGAHNCIVTTRAGKDLISSIVSGLLTIGPRFGGAVDGAAKEFARAYDENLSPRQFVEQMRKDRKLIPGIGHRIKSLENPDKRVEILKQYFLENFPRHPLLDFALEVEQVTSAKKSNLILNVDGMVGVSFVDLLRTCGAFSKEETDEYLEVGFLNGLFVLGRTIGLIGHHLDQKLLKQGLYRHPWDDISYIRPDDMFSM